MAKKDDHWIAFPFSENHFQSASLSVRENENLIEPKIESSFEKKLRRLEYINISKFSIAKLFSC